MDTQTFLTIEDLASFWGAKKERNLQVKLAMCLEDVPQGKPGYKTSRRHES